VAESVSPPELTCDWALTHSAILYSLTEKWGIILHLDTSDMNESETEQQCVSDTHYVKKVKCSRYRPCCGPEGG
jgi:hypothetical protein